MFENIIGHKSTIKQIKDEILEDRFPGSSVITGPVYSGKQTLALEIARSLTCSRKGDWGCMCESCRLQRTLLHPSTLLAGFDRFLPEIIMTGGIMVKKKGEMFSRFLFIRSVRKLIKRFDPVFSDNNDPKIKKIIPVIRELEEALQTIEPEGEIKPELLTEKSSEIILKCEKIIKDINISGVTVDQIRKITFWVHTTGYREKKVIIIENCEKMNESSRNAVLKVLEEPPEGVHFIFLTARYGEIIPTIRSRLRKYELKERNLQESRDVIEKIFREKPGIEFSIHDFFNSWTKEHDLIKKSAKEFITDLFDVNKESSPVVYEMKKIIKSSGRDALQVFLESVLEYSRMLIKNNEFMESSPDMQRRMKKLSELVNTGFKNNEILNINPELVIENIFFRMRNCI